ncbi:MAG: protoporphyrinogen oxidase [Antricoccus sp.]
MIDQSLPASCDVVIVGAGIAGLSAAYQLHKQRPDWDVHVLEISDRVGGKLQRAQVGGYTVDVGAEAVLTTRPEAVDLIDEVGLVDHRRAPGVLSSAVALGGSQYALPAGHVMGVPTDIEALRASGILSDSGFARFGQPGGRFVDDDLSVAEVIGGEYGPEVVDRLVEPLLSGVYAGRAEALSMRSTLPALYEAALRTGDLRGAAKGLRRPPRSKTDPAIFTTLDGGLAGLAEAVRCAAQATVHLRCPARAITRSATGFDVEVGTGADPRRIQSKAVIVATPPSKTAMLLRSVSAAAARALAEVPTASMAVIQLAYRLTDLANSIPEGSGFLVPASEKTAVKAATFVTNKWPHITDDSGVAIVRTSIGRVGEEALLQREDAELVALARRDLALLVGISGDPYAELVHRWGGGLPQYNVGHSARIARINVAVNLVDRLAVAGATYRGIGVPACISSGVAAAEDIVRTMQTGRG